MSNIISIDLTPVDDAEQLVQRIIAEKDISALYGDVLIEAVAVCPRVKRMEFQQKLAVAFGKDFRASFWKEKIKVAFENLQTRRATTQPVAPGAADLLSQRLNDNGNAERLLAVHGRNMLYCPSMKKWLLWDGRRWVIDQTNRAQELCKDALLKFNEQVETRNSGDEHLRKFANASLDGERIRKAMHLASSVCPVMAAELDCDPWALNCLNGTVDLRTGAIRPHDRGDRITKLVRHDYNTEANCPTWLSFLHNAMGEGPETEQQIRADRLVAYIQRALGYSLTGSTREKALFIPLGEHGDNGKSTMLYVVREIISDYAQLVEVETLMVRHATNNTQADLADLRGARFVQTSETEEGQRLSQSIIKKLTAGMGPVKACRKFENPTSFLPTHHIWLETNNMPSVNDPDDTATLSRLHPIPFLVVIPPDKIDRTMPDKLLAEAPGILAWMIIGAREWFGSGLGKPEEVIQACEEWKGTQTDHPWTARIERWLTERQMKYRPQEKRPYFTVSIASILEDALQFKVKEIHRGHSSTVGRILKRLEWVVDKQEGPSKTRVYRNSKPTNSSTE